MRALGPGIGLVVVGLVLVACDGAAPSSDGGATDAAVDAALVDAAPDASVCGGEPPRLTCFGGWPSCCDEGPMSLEGRCDPELARWACPAGTHDHCDCEGPPDGGP